MGRPYVKVIGVFLVAGFLSGCASFEPRIYDVRSAPVPVPRDSATLNQLADAILRAGASLGWQMHRLGPNDVAGAFNVYRAHAMVDVHFTQHSYDIRYRDSSHLGAAHGHIERRYNAWIRSLNRQIQLQIACIGRIQCRQSL